MPVALPATVLQRRPDVASAERAVAAANANIGVAKAAYFPTTMVSAGGGWNSNQFSNLFNAPSILWSLGASLTQTIFDGGKNSANLKIAESNYKATVAAYRQSVLVAMQEVQTGIDTATQLKAAEIQLQASVDASTHAAELANARYQGGVDSYINVVTAEQSLLANQRQLAQIKGQEMVNAVYLIKALGGGWAGL